MASQIAVQLFTLREYTKTPADIAKTFARVKKIGYDAVQCSALGPIDPKELAKILQGEGLTCCATHTGLDALRDQPEQTIENHKLWGCSLTAIGGWGWKDVDDANQWISFAKEYSAIARKYEGSGLAIGYHNHSHELVKYNGETVLDLLFKNFSQDVWMEVDTYWITHGGGDPIQYINKYAGRLPAIHLKDMGIGVVDGERKQLMREIGEGNLNFPGIIEAARKAGVQWFIIEQDNCNGLDPFDCIERSLKNAQDLGLQ